MHAQTIYSLSVLQFYFPQNKTTKTLKSWQTSLFLRWRSFPLDSPRQRLLYHRIEFVTAVQAGSHSISQCVFPHLPVRIQTRHLIQIGKQSNGDTSPILPVSLLPAPTLLWMWWVNEARVSILSQRTTQHHIIHFNTAIRQGHRGAGHRMCKNRAVILQNDDINLNLRAWVSVEANSWLQTLEQSRGQISFLAALDPGTPFQTGKRREPEVANKATGFHVRFVLTFNFSRSVHRAYDLGVSSLEVRRALRLADQPAARKHWPHVSIPSDALSTAGLGNFVWGKKKQRGLRLLRSTDTSCVKRHFQ